MVGAAVSGKIALIDRGTCDFTVKVMNAQNAGAIGVVVANNEGTTASSAMGGVNKRIRIPSLMIGKDGGAALRATATSGTMHKKVTPMIDASLDSDIVFHEYGHGLTWRMIGGMSGKLAGAIGEGASDTLAFLIDGDDVIAEYSASSAGGIRRYPYSEHEMSYGQVTGAGVHNDGEIYAAAMWDVLENYLAADLTASDVLHDFVQGMRYTPATPAFETMRDGMLQAIRLAGSGRECLVWRGFAAHGVGVGAKGVIRKTGRVTITPSIALPTECQ